MNPQTDLLASILEILEMYQRGELTTDELEAALKFVKPGTGTFARGTSLRESKMARILFDKNKMTKIAIRAEGLGKQYRLGAKRERTSARDTLTRLAGAPLRAARSLRLGNFRRSERKTFWALRDVNFEINAGEAVGIIGGNGAGKSTLLKVLSRITDPTEGRVTIQGRLSSLLEVGTGFHPELSGRDNIYLNGAILGMRRAEIERKFDEIVAFSEVEKFLDTPVKHYSSGMHMRLAFSVAAHLEPEVLLVDEVLAVGDAGFQKKCLGKMDEVSQQGRTVLFVSHNMAAVSQLTRQSVVLSGGEVSFIGSTDQAIGHYLKEIEADTETVYRVGEHGRRLAGHSHDLEFVSFELREHNHKLIAGDADLVVWITLKANRSISNSHINNTIYKADGTPVGTTHGPGSLSLKAGEVSTIEFRMRDLRLAPGHYLCGFGVGQGNPDSAFDVVLDVVSFQVVQPTKSAVTVWYANWGAVRFSQATYEAVEE